MPPRLAHPAKYCSSFAVDARICSHNIDLRRVANLELAPELTQFRRLKWRQRFLDCGEVFPPKDSSLPIIKPLSWHGCEVGCGSGRCRVEAAALSCDLQMSGSRAQDLPMVQAHRRKSGYHTWHKIFVKFALSHVLFLSLRGKLKEQESGG